MPDPTRDDPGTGGSLPAEPRPGHDSGAALVRGTIFNFLGYAIPLLIGFAAMPFIIHSLGTARFGILSLAWVVVGYFGFFDFGLGRATTKFAAEAFGRGALEAVPGLFWTTTIVQAGLGLLGLAIMIGLTPWLVGRFLQVAPELVGEASAALYLLALSIPIVLVSGAFRGLLEAARRFGLMNAVKIPSSALSYLMPALGVLLGMKLPGIMALMVAGRAASLAAWAVLCFRAVPGLRVRPRIDRRAVRPLLSFGGWVFVGNLVGPLLSSLDRLFIGSRISVTAVGYYSAPMELLGRMGIVSGSVATTLFPTFSALHGGRDRERSGLIYWLGIKAIVLGFGSGLVLLLLFAGDFLRLWLGRDFQAESTLVLQILAAGVLANGVAFVPFAYVQSLGRADLTAKYGLGELVLYAPLCWLMIGTWGLAGAAAAWTVRSVLDAGLLFGAAHRLGVRVSGLVRERVLVSVGILAGSAVAGLIWIRPRLGLAGLAGLAILTAAAVWTLGLTGEERAWGGRWIRRTVLRHRPTPTA